MENMVPGTIYFWREVAGSGGVCHTPNPCFRWCKVV